MLRRLADVCYRRRRLVVVGWIVALVLLTVAANALGPDLTDGFGLGAGDSTRARDLLESDFSEQAGDAGQLVIATDAGIADAQVRRQAEAALALIADVPGVVGVRSPYAEGAATQIARSGNIAYAEIQFAKRSNAVPEATTERLRAIVADANTPKVRFEVGGRMFNQPRAGGSSELIGLGAAVLILLVAFGSVLAMGLPIGIALFGIGAGFAMITFLSHVFVTPEFTTQLAAMIGLGVGIDYALFIVTRYRQGLQDGLDPARAVVLAIDTAGRSVLIAGATVVISLCGLFLMGVDFVRGLGAGAAVTVLMMMIASVTLLPALLGFCGRSIDKLRIPGLHRHEGATRASIWFRWSRVVQARPWTAALAGLVVLVVLAIPVFGLRFGFSDAGNNPTTDTARRAYDLLSDGFGPGFNGPLLLAAETPRGSASLDQLKKALSNTEGVAQVSPALANASDTAAIIQVIPTTSPQNERTVELIDRLREKVIPAATAGARSTVYVGGITAAGVDASSALAARLPVFIGAVLALSFLLLLAVFRSIYVPIKAVVMNVLSIGAAYGVLVAIFQWGWGASLLGVVGTGPIEPFLPMMLFAVVFGLSMDYEVFLLSRIREEYDRTGDNALAVADGLATTARVITAAAAIMITVAASFVPGDSRVVKLFGIGLAAAVLIDATLVRMLLVPATMEILGDRNWWFPAWLNRIVPRLHVAADPGLDAEISDQR